MSGQLVIAELDAFRAVLGKVQRREGETVKVWCRSTITNAVHRIGPSASLKAAAEAVWTAADDLSQSLDNAGSANGDIDQAREHALGALDRLIATIRLVKVPEA